MSAAAQLPPEREGDLHLRVADLLALVIGPTGQTSRDGVWWSTIDHADWHKDAVLKRKRRGVAPGLPDIFVLHGKGRLHCIELKRAKGGRLSEAQNGMIVALLRAGAEFAVCRSCLEVVAALDQWKIPHLRVDLGAAA